MSGETRVTKISKLKDVRASGESCLVMIAGPFLGKKYPLVDEDEFTVGRDEKNFIVIDMDNVSRRHAQVTHRVGRFFVNDLQSTNGTYLNDEEIREEQPLRSGDLVKIGSAIFKFLSGNNIEQQYYEEIYTLTICDGLTQVNNKRFFLEFLERELAVAVRQAQSLSLVMIDIDHFKKINDTHGHLAGDAALKELCRRLGPRMRTTDLLARYGGEEFAAVLTGTDLPGALRVAEDLRALVERAPFTHGELAIPCTISLGVAEVDRAAPGRPEELIGRADANLYEAKRSGRNRAVG